MSLDPHFRCRRWWRHGRRVLSWAAGLAALVLAVFCIDGPACAWMRANQETLWERVARLVSSLGDWPALAVLGTLALVVVARIGNRRWVHVLCVMLTASVLAGAAANVVRATTGRARPNAKIEKRWYGPLDGKRWTVGRHAYSAFPSAHTTVSAAFVAPLVLFGWRWGAAALALMILVGWSRFYLGVHHPSDVLAGAVLGWSCAWVLCFAPPSRRVFRRLANRLSRPRKAVERGGRLPVPIEEAGA